MSHGGGIGDALAYLDARKRFAGKQLGELASDPAGLLGQWGTQTLDDASQGSRSMLDASRQMMDPATRGEGMQAMLAGMPMGLLSVHQFRTPKAKPPTYSVSESTGNLPDLAGLTPDQRLMWELYLQKMQQQSLPGNVTPLR